VKTTIAAKDDRQSGLESTWEWLLAVSFLLWMAFLGGILWETALVSVVVFVGTLCVIWYDKRDLKMASSLAAYTGGAALLVMALLGALTWSP